MQATGLPQLLSEAQERGDGTEPDPSTHLPQAQSLPTFSHSKMVPRCLHSRRLEPNGCTTRSCHFHTWLSVEDRQYQEDLQKAAGIGCKLGKLDNKRGQREGRDPDVGTDIFGGGKCTSAHGNWTHGEVQGAPSTTTTGPLHWPCDKVFPNFQPPSPYTGELYGMEYLLEQSGHTMGLTDLDSEIDEGFEEEMAEEDILPNEDLQDPRVMMTEKWDTIL